MWGKWKCCERQEFQTAEPQQFSSAGSCWGSHHLIFACQIPSSNHNLTEFIEVLGMQLRKYLQIISAISLVHSNAAVHWKLTFSKFTVLSSVPREFSTATCYSKPVCILTNGTEIVKMENGFVLTVRLHVCWVLNSCQKFSWQSLSSAMSPLLWNLLPKRETVKNLIS